MRSLLLAVLIALLLPLSMIGSLVPGAHATEEVKFKGRGKNPPPSQQHREKQPQPEQPPQRPPDKQHPEKRLQDPRAREKRPADPRPEQPQRPYVPEPPCPPPIFDPVRAWEHCDPVPFPDDPIVINPVPIDMESALSRRMRTLNIEGFVGQVVVGWDGQIHFERSYGDGGRYDVAAVTRAFTAWAVCLLVDTNVLEWSTTLGELFPGIPPDKRHVTIEHLLANTSGLRNTYAADGEADRDTAVGKLLAQPLAHAPGKEFTDSDDGYVILAAAIEVASGMTYEDYMLETEIVSREMTGTIFSNDLEAESWGRRGSGGILSTAHDLYRWATSFTEQPVDLVDQIVRPREWTDDSVGIGYGWFSTDSNQPTLWTSGTGDFDHNVMVVVYPSNTILVVTSDRFHGDVPWSERVANTLEPFLLRWTPVDPDPRLYRADSR